MWRQLPNCTGDVKVDVERFNWLNSQERYRNMLQQVRTQVLQEVRKDVSEAEGHVAILTGGTTDMWQRFCTDTEIDNFRPEPSFAYVFGGECFHESGVVGAIDIARGEFLIFLPKSHPDAVRWCGEPKPLSEHAQYWGLQGAHDLCDMETVLKERGCTTVHVLDGVNKDSGLRTLAATFPGIENFTVEREMLYTALERSRTTKTPLEVEFLRKACEITQEAHLHMWKHMHAGMNEAHAEGLFNSYVRVVGGARCLAYTAICGAGKNAAILHYNKNNATVGENDLLLADCGGEFTNYATDVTTTWPVSGVFTPVQKVIVGAVAAAQEAVLSQMKPGVMWPDMHRLAERVILTSLKEAGVLQGDVDAMMEAKLGATFMPHGLGHLIGLQVHDVGGFTPEFPRLTEKGVCYLRTSRRLEEGMYITAEPGCYFIRPLLEKALADESQASFIVQDKLEEYIAAGGCRLEDNVYITADGIDNLTAHLPRAPADVETCIAELRQ
ncbi:MAG: hypothetical protein MHM6MM_003613 [Cercozoa sp. M6MM]